MDKETKKEFEKDIKEFVTRDEFEDLMGRVKYIEQKLGIESGK